MEVSITGQQELFNALKNFEQQAVLKDADYALQRAGMYIIADAQETLRQKNINTTGRLSQSGRVQRVKDGFDVGFMSGESNYAGAVEFGRRPGLPPPYKKIRQWLRKKHSGDFNAIRSAAAFAGKKYQSYLTGIAIATAKSIGKKGTKPNPFFAPAVAKNQAMIVREIAEAIQRTINRLTTNV